MMKIGFSYWGVCYNFETHRSSKLDTPDGHRYGRPIFAREILERGHELIALQEYREEFGYFSVGFNGGDGQIEYPMAPDYRTGEVERFPDLDVIFMEWRWPTWKNDKTHPQHDPKRYEPDLDRQLEVLRFYHGKVPIVLWDTDLKITPEDERAWPEAILADPTFLTNRLTRDRVSLPFWTDWKELIPTSDPYPVYGYVGNNYERPEEFNKFYFGVKQDTRLMGVQTSMYGNWLQKSPERESPASLISTHREVAFNHRMNFYDSMQIMNRFICTTHVSKPRYYETGFMSPRYLEALAVNCPGLVPVGMAQSPALAGRTLLGSNWVVEKPTDITRILRTLKDLTLDERVSLVEGQRWALKKCGKFDVKDVVDYLESLV